MIFQSGRSWGENNDQVLINAVSEKYVLGRPITSGRIVGYSSNWLPQEVANLCAVSDLLAIRNLRISPSRISTDKRRFRQWLISCRDADCPLPICPNSPQPRLASGRHLRQK